MNVQELLVKLEQNKIPSSWYSINGDLSSDIYVLRRAYDHWEFFYIDERGNQDNDYRRFDNESEACNYLYDKLIFEKEHYQYIRGTGIEILTNQGTADGM